MMRAHAALLLLSAALAAGGCNSDFSGSKTPVALAGLHGTWSSDRVPVSGHGHFEGIATHEYNADGTFRAEAEFTDPTTGCHVELHYVGNYTGDRSAIEVRPSGGEVEVASCKDASQNAARRPYDDKELQQANSTVKWQVRDGVLSLVHGDGMERSFRRPSETLTGLHGTWAADSVAVSGHGQYEGIASHTFNKDGTYRWKATFTDPKTGCRGDLHYSGNFTGNAKLLKAKASSGEVEVTGCSDNGLNKPRRRFTEAELAAASDSIAWSVDGQTLALTHADGLEREYARR